MATKLTVEEMKLILTELVNKKPLSIKTPEGRALRKEFERDLEDARKKGHVLDFPHDGMDK